MILTPRENGSGSDLSGQFLGSGAGLRRRHGLPHRNRPPLGVNCVPFAVAQWLQWCSALPRCETDLQRRPAAWPTGGQQVQASRRAGVRPPMAPSCQRASKPLVLISPASCRRPLAGRAKLHELVQPYRPGICWVLWLTSTRTWSNISTIRA